MTKKRPITFEIEVQLDQFGEPEARITLPEGASKGRDADTVAPLTEQIAQKLGRIKERHRGRNVGGVHTHTDGTTHEHS